MSDTFAREAAVKVLKGAASALRHETALTAAQARDRRVRASQAEGWWEELQARVDGAVAAFNEATGGVVPPVRVVRSSPARVAVMAAEDRTLTVGRAEDAVQVTERSPRGASAAWIAVGVAAEEDVLTPTPPELAERILTPWLSSLTTGGAR